MRKFEKADVPGGIRFIENPIVRHLLDVSQARGYGLNQLHAGDFSTEAWEEFYQLIGYSLAGYHELRLVSDKSALEATRAARLQLGDNSIGGCRDDGCPIHTKTAKPRKTRKKR